MPRRRALGRVVPTIALAATVTATMTVTVPQAHLTAGIRLTATYAVGPTQIPGLVNLNAQALESLADKYIVATLGSVPAPFTVVDYPASAFPITGLSSPTADESQAIGKAQLAADVAGDPAPVIFGYSQGASVITLYKRDFNQAYANPALNTEPGTAVPQPTFVLIGNITRPNGGFFARIPGLSIPGIGLTLYGPMPTETAGAAPGQITTYDVVGQYDGAADFPAYPTDLLALANAALGVLYVHAQYQNLNVNDAVSQGQYGDTAYYMIPTKLLPLLQPLAQLGVPSPILAALDAPLRVLVEAGYNRTASPGQPTPAGLIPAVNPAELATNFLRAIPTGLDDGLQQLGLGRPFGTTPAGPYGVGGSPVTPTPAAMHSATAHAVPHKNTHHATGEGGDDSTPRPSKTPHQHDKAARK